MLGNILQCTAPPPTKNHLAPKTNSVEVKKPCLRHSITNERELLFPESSNESLGLAGPGWHIPEEVTVVRVLSCPYRQSGSNTPLVPWQGIISTQILWTEGAGRVVPQRKIRMFVPEEG